MRQELCPKFLWRCGLRMVSVIFCALKWTCLSCDVMAVLCWSPVHGVTSFPDSVYVLTLSLQSSLLCTHNERRARRSRAEQTMEHLCDKHVGLRSAKVPHVNCERNSSGRVRTSLGSQPPPLPHSPGGLSGPWQTPSCCWCGAEPPLSHRAGIPPPVRRWLPCRLSAAARAAGLKPGGESLSPGGGPRAACIGP